MLHWDRSLNPLPPTYLTAIGDLTARRLFIVHGWGGTPDENWLPWLRAMAGRRGFDAHAPAMPDASNPREARWVGELAAEVGEPDADSYFVGHSLGCMAILRYLEGLGEGEMVGGVVLVAGFSESIGIPEIDDFFKRPVDWIMVNRHCSRFVAIASDDDPYVPLRQADMLEDGLRARKLVIPRMGHFNMIELHVALNELLKMTAR